MGSRVREGDRTMRGWHMHGYWTGRTLKSERSFFSKFEMDVERLLAECETDGEALNAYYCIFCKTAILKVSESLNSNVDWDSCGDSEADLWSWGGSVVEDHAEYEKVWLEGSVNEINVTQKV